MKIALSLGSGGARGFAHIGVIEELEERGHQIVAVSGASMGALVGGVYAAGKLPEFRDWAYGLTQASVFKLLDFVWRGPGIVRADRVVGEVSEIIGNVLIEDLNIPYTAVATDITTRREIWFQSGPLEMAIRASIAIPSVITPVSYEGRILADGGVLNPVPVEPLAPVVSDATIAVALSGRPTIAGTPAASAEDIEEGDVKVKEESSQGWITKFLTWGSESPAEKSVHALAPHLRRRDKSGSTGTAVEELTVDEIDPGPVFNTLPESLKVADVIMMSLETMQDAVERYRMAANPPDLLITVPRDTASTYDFHRAQDIADVGREKAIAAFDAVGL